MNITITYKIRFFSDWHCGSGLSSGADTDLLVIKDKEKMPFVPGKTMKGLIKEALEDIQELDDQYAELDLVKILGKEAKVSKGLEKTDESKKETDGRFSQNGCCFFKNAELDKELRDHIVNNRLQDYLYHSISSTAIKDGVAKEHSLRKMQVTVPCELTGEILDVPKEYGILFKDALSYIKRLGQSRNRGLGRCLIEIISPEIIEEGKSS